VATIEILSPAQSDALFAAAVAEGAGAAALIGLMLWDGLRTAEVATLEEDYVGADCATVTVAGDLAPDSHRVVTLDARTATELRLLMAHRAATGAAGPLFVESLSEGGLSEVRAVVRWCAEIAGVPVQTAQSLRMTALARLAGQ
jgi:integrase